MTLRLVTNDTTPKKSSKQKKSSEKPRRPKRCDMEKADSWYRDLEGYESNIRETGKYFSQIADFLWSAGKLVSPQARCIVAYLISIPESKIPTQPEIEEATGISSARKYLLELECKHNMITREERIDKGGQVRIAYSPNPAALWKVPGAEKFQTKGVAYVPAKPTNMTWEERQKFLMTRKIRVNKAKKMYSTINNIGGGGPLNVAGGPLNVAGGPLNVADLQGSNPTPPKDTGDYNTISNTTTNTKVGREDQPTQDDVVNNDSPLYQNGYQPFQRYACYEDAPKKTRNPVIDMAKPLEGYFQQCRKNPRKYINKNTYNEATFQMMKKYGKMAPESFEKWLEQNLGTLPRGVNQWQWKAWGTLVERWAKESGLDKPSENYSEQNKSDDCHEYSTHSYADIPHPEDDDVPSDELIMDNPKYEE